MLGNDGPTCKAYKQERTQSNTQIKGESPERNPIAQHSSQLIISYSFFSLHSKFNFQHCSGLAGNFWKKNCIHCSTSSCAMRERNSNVAHPHEIIVDFQYPHRCLSNTSCRIFKGTCLSKMNISLRKNGHEIPVIPHREVFLWIIWYL